MRMHRFRIWLLLALLVGLTPTAASTVAPAPVGLGAPQALRAEPLALRQLPTTPQPDKAWPTTADGRLAVIVELEGPPAVARNDKATSEQRAALQTAVRAEQDAWLAALPALAPSATVDYRYDLLFNGVSLWTAAADLPALAAAPGVRRLYPDATYTTTLDASINLLRAPVFWSLVGGQSNAGAGVKIAVIDSGIEPTHPLFSGAGYSAPPGYPRGYCLTEPAFCSGKVLVARWYGAAGGVPSFASPLERPTPQDRQGHGSHVAAIAAGNAGVVGNVGDGVLETLSGVAPRAHLLIYKACWREASGQQNASCLTSGLLAALQDAVLDGADVINNSWGGGPGGDPYASPFRAAIANAVAAGVTVVFAAGNDGPDARTIACPGCVADAVTVGSTTTDRIHANRLDVTGPGIPPGHLVDRPLLASAEGPLSADLSAVVLWAGRLDAANAEGCQSWPANTFAQAIALIARGSCSFQTKVGHAAAAGARAVLIVNNQPGAPLRMSVGPTAIPALMLTQRDGNALRDWAVANHPTAAVSLKAAARRYSDPSWQDFVWTTSARGPNGDPSVLKPDLVAPGVEILSADDIATPTTGFQFLTGTSMAAPHVAGAAALLVQRFPAWSPRQIKSALMSTAVSDGLVQENGAIAATPFDRGAGRLDLGRLALVGATFDAPSFAEPACAGRCIWRNRLVNELAIQTTWTASVQAPAGLAVAVAPSTLTAPARGGARFDVTIDVANLTPFRWYFATLTWQESGGGATAARLPLAVYALPGESRLFEKTADAPFPLFPGDSLTYHLHLRNAGRAPLTYDVSDPLPPNLSYVPGSASSGLTYRAAERRLTATAVVPPTFLIESRDLGGYISLADAGIPPQPCAGLCDDDWFEASGLDFTFMGRRVSELYVSSNGFVSLGPPDGAVNIPQRFPNPATPNGVIAPLWADLDLQGDPGDPAGGGRIYAARVTSAENPTGWTVFEWKDAQHWSAPQVVYSFQLWIQNGTGNLWFAYGPLINFGLYPATVGVEDGDGYFGYTHYYKAESQPAEGDAPSGAAELLLLYSPGVTYSFRATADYGDAAVNVATASGPGGILTATERTPIAADAVWLPIVVR